jgi:chaperonin cofactor prefoldin
METTYKTIDGKIEVISMQTKTYSLKELKAKKEDLKLRKAMAISTQDKIQTELDEVKVLIDQCKTLNIVE